MFFFQRCGRVGVSSRVLSDAFDQALGAAGGVEGLDRRPAVAQAGEEEEAGQEDQGGRAQHRLPHTGRGGRHQGGGGGGGGVDQGCDTSNDALNGTQWKDITFPVMMFSANRHHIMISMAMSSSTREQRSQFLVSRK